MRIAVVGATGLVGDALLRVLERCGAQVDEVRAFATARSAGLTIEAFGRAWPVRALEAGADGRELFRDLDAAFFAVGERASREFAPAAAAAGALVVDKSSAFRLDPAVPLVVPEVNAAAAVGHRLIANPNCATIPLAVALGPIERAFGLSYVSVATYQSVSGAGKDAVDEFRAQLAGGDDVRALPRRIAGNVVPENGPFDSDGHGEEERKIAAEFRKIVDRADLPMSATSVRVPVDVGHCEAVAFGTRGRATLRDIEGALREAAGVTFMPGAQYATALDVAGTDRVAVGRLRPDGAHDGGFLVWIACDNLRKGAATNAVQILEAMQRVSA